jgi:hypothetical protein
VEGELRGTPDHFEGFIRIRDPGEFDDDAFLSRALQGWLGDPELIDAPTQDLEGSGHRVDIDSLGLRFPSLEDDLRAALEVESESNGMGNDEGCSCAYDGEDDERSPKKMTSQ